jgi:hypothetical protein
MRDGMLVAVFAALQSTIEWLRRLETTCHFNLSASSIVDTDADARQPFVVASRRMPYRRRNKMTGWCIIRSGGPIV